MSQKVMVSHYINTTQLQLKKCRIQIEIKPVLKEMKQVLINIDSNKTTCFIDTIKGVVTQKVMSRNNINRQIWKLSVEAQYNCFLVYISFETCEQENYNRLCEILSIYILATLLTKL